MKTGGLRGAISGGVGAIGFHRLFGVGYVEGGDVFAGGWGDVARGNERTISQNRPLGTYVIAGNPQVTGFAKKNAILC